MLKGRLHSIVFIWVVLLGISGCNMAPIGCFESHVKIEAGNTANLYVRDDVFSLSNGIDIDGDGYLDIAVDCGLSTSGHGCTTINRCSFNLSDGTAILTQTASFTQLVYYNSTPGYLVWSVTTTDLEVPATADSFNYEEIIRIRPVNVEPGFMSDDESEFAYTQGSVESYYKLDMANCGNLNSTHITFSENDYHTGDNYLMFKKENECGTIWGWIKYHYNGVSTELVSYAYSTAEMQ